MPLNRTKMVRVICLDEEVPCSLVPCGVCFTTMFHNECFELYRRTKNTCPTCKATYVPIRTPAVQQTVEEERVARRFPFYHTCMVTQFLVLIFTVAFMPRKDLFEFWTLLLTILFLTCLNVFERVPSAYVFFTICAGMSTACTITNTILFNHKPIYIVYSVTTTANCCLHAVSTRRGQRIHPVQNDDASRR